MKPVEDLMIACSKLAQAALLLERDQPQTAFGEISDALTLGRAAIDEVAEECGRRGFYVGQDLKKRKRK